MKERPGKERKGASLGSVFKGNLALAIERRRKAGGIGDKVVRKEEAMYQRKGGAEHGKDSKVMAAPMRRREEKALETRSSREGDTATPAPKVKGDSNGIKAPPYNCGERGADVPFLQTKEGAVNPGGGVQGGVEARGLRGVQGGLPEPCRGGGSDSVFR